MKDASVDKHGNRLSRATWLLLTPLAGVLAVATLALGFAAIVPGAGLFSAAGAVALPVLGPWLVVAAVVALLLSAVRRRRGSPRRAATVIFGTSVLSTVLNVALIIIFVVQVSSAGGSVNPVTALALGSMNSDAPDETTSYSTPDGTSFPVSIWKPETSAQPAPVLFYIHGGGWVGGDSSGGGAEWRWFAERGWLVVSVGYELATQEQHTWDRAPAQVACALGWAGDAVARYGGDPSRLVVAGDSAGGNLAVDLAYGAATDTCGEPPTIRAVAVQYPVVDPVGTWDENFSVGSARGSTARDFLSDYTGGSPTQFPDRYRAISSSTYLSAAAPPTLVISPRHDSLVPPSGVHAFVEAARNTGVHVTEVDIPFSNHAYDAYASGSLGNQARQTITDTWLKPYVTARQ